MCTGMPGWNLSASSTSTSLSPGMRSRCLPSGLPVRPAAKRQEPRSARMQRARPSGLPGTSETMPCSKRSRCLCRTADSEVGTWWAAHCSWNSWSHRSCAKPTGCFAPDCRSSEASGKSTRSRSRGPSRSRARPSGTSAAVANSERAVSAPSRTFHGNIRCCASTSQSAAPIRSATPPSSPSWAARSVRRSRATAPSIEPARSMASLPEARDRRRSSRESSSLLCTSSLERSRSRLSNKLISGTGGMA
mmetsp:Transcript_50275/g.155796  ORF Transcript_50275/g.155796 Transcript_50275/m.155796 type:complete len:248 (-) Transcript_50275:483-1226(-)